MWDSDCKLIAADGAAGVQDVCVGQREKYKSVWPSGVKTVQRDDNVVRGTAEKSVHCYIGPCNPYLMCQWLAVSEKRRTLGKLWPKVKKVGQVRR